MTPLDPPFPPPLVRDCPISIEGRMLLTNHVVFKMLGFDVILDIDWLSRHYTSIDYHRKEVVFRWASNLNLLGRWYELFCPYYRWFRQGDGYVTDVGHSWLAYSQRLRLRQTY